MQEWLVRAAWWQLALVCAPVIAVVTTVVARLSREDTWGGAAVVGIPAGVLCGAALGGMMRAQFARTQELYDGLPEGEERAAVLRGTLRGPVPTDPAVRAAVADLAEQQLLRMDRGRVWAPVSVLVLAAGSAALALTRSAWWWVAVLLFVAAAPFHEITRRRLPRRLAELQGDT